MNSKIAYLVFGAESSCTRFITNCLIKAGCTGRTWNDNHEQEIDFEEPTDNLVVWRRSFPHKWDDPDNFPYIIKGTIGWPDTDAMYDRLVKLGYTVKVIITMRDWFTVSMSGVNKRYRPHTNTMEKAYNNTKESYKRIFNFVNKYDLDYIVFNYEAMIVSNLKYVNEMLKVLELNPINDVEFVNGNQKYYDDIKWWG